MIYPNIDPVALAIGPLEIRWYGVCYLIGILAALYVLKCLKPRESEAWYQDLLFNGILGIILGGRIGYVLIYNPMSMISDPLFLLEIWRPGMSFHGGFIGVLIGMYCLAHKYKMSFWSITDRLAQIAPIGLMAGRLGNVLNAELWGRPTDLSWGVIYPFVDHLPRHPWPVYAMFSEGIILMLFLQLIVKNTRAEGLISAAFLIGYGGIRFLEEFFRQPDAHLGFIAWGWLTMGQLLSVPLMAIGIWLWIKALKASKGASNASIS